MKKLTIVFFLALAAIFIFPNDLQAQKFKKLDKSPMDLAAFPRRGSKKVVKVYYSRPQLKGRALSKLAPKGKVWRTGANEATEITFYQDVKIGGQALKAGTYTLFTIPDDEQWTLIINSKLHQWGAYTYKEKNDVLRSKGSVKTKKKLTEAFTMTFDKNKNGADLVLGWGNVIVRFPIEF